MKNGFNFDNFTKYNYNMMSFYNHIMSYCIGYAYKYLIKNKLYDYRYERKV